MPKEGFVRIFITALTFFQIKSPALRDRLDDLPLLIDVLLDRIVESAKLVSGIHFDSEALRVLRSYAWPGNVRELENVIERLAIINFIPSAGDDIYAIALCGLQRRPVRWMRNSEN